jgi:hypothetical protein
VLVGLDRSANGRDAVALAPALTDRDGRITLAPVHSGMLRPSSAVIAPGLAGEPAIAAPALLWRERAATGGAAAAASITATSPARGLQAQAARAGAA